MKLTNVRKIGRYRNEKTGQEVNVHKGQRVGRLDDITFYLLNGKKTLISDVEKFSDWKRI